MDLLFRHAWIALVGVTVFNGRASWKQAQSLIQARPELEPGYRRLLRGYLFWANLPWLVMGLGTVTGRVPSLLDFLRPSDGNGFVLAWWGLLGALLCLGSYWMLVGGGAEMLERHPGLFMVPHWPASRLRLFWLGVVAWNVVIASLLFLGFPSSPTGLDRRPSLPAWGLALFLVLFVAVWLALGFLLSAMGGWRALAEYYGAPSPFTGRRFVMRSARFGGYVNYASCLSLGADREKLYLAVLPIFRLGHTPLAIPWADITAREGRSWFWPHIELRFAKAPGVAMQIARRLAEEIFDAAGTAIPVQPE